MRISTCCLMLLAIAVPTIGAAQFFPPLREIEAPGWDRGGEDDLFGYALAMDGPQLIVGIPGAPTSNAPGQGMVEVYAPVLGGWTLIQRLLPAQNDADEKFGDAIAVSGDDLVVGSWDAGFGDSQAPGSVHVYRRDGGQWQAVARLVAPDIDAADGFGSAVAVQGDWLAATAPGYDDETGVRGAVFLYRRNGAGWSFVQRILGDDLSRAGGFGCTMAMGGDRLYVTDCLGDSATRQNTGAVYWYQLGDSAATPRGQVSVANVGSGDFYGYALAATPTHVAIAALDGGPQSPSPDRVYVFGREGDGHVLQLERLLPLFAVNIHLAADRLLVTGPTCPSLTSPGLGISCVRRFDRNGANWSETSSYLQQPEVGYQGFGFSIVADAKTIHVGNPFRDVAAGPSSGAVSTFDVDMPGNLPTTLELPAGLWRFPFNTVVDGDLMVTTDSRIGTPDQFNEGTAWVFDIANGDSQLLTRIDNPEPYTYERFASDAGIVGNRLVLSSLRRVPGGSSIVLRTYQRNGAAINFIDEFDVFSLPQLSEVSLSTGFQMSGDRLALSGTVVTARGRSPRIVVLLRQGNSWQLEALLLPPAQDEEVAINFSRMVMQGDRIALLRGEIRQLPAEPRAWAAFVYRRTGTVWNLETTLRPLVDDPPATVLADIAISGDEIALSTWDTLQSFLRTRIHTFGFDGMQWQRLQRIEAPAGIDEFGRQLSIANGLLAVESFPLTTISGNFVTPLRLYRRDGAAWNPAGMFLPALAATGQGRLADFSNPLLLPDGQLFAAGDRDGPGVTTHGHGVIFRFNALDPLFGNGME